MIVIIGLIIVILLFIFVWTVVLKKKIDEDEIKYQLEEFKKSRALVGTLCIVIA